MIDCSTSGPASNTMLVEIPAKVLAGMANTRGLAIMREHRFVMRDCIIGDHVVWHLFVSVGDCSW